VKGPFRYVARKPEDIKFVALKQEKEMSAPELLAMYEKDSFMKQYVPIIKEKEQYPLILGKKNGVVSKAIIVNPKNYLKWFQNCFIILDPH